FLGSNAGIAATTSRYNVLLGHLAGSKTTTGISNTMVGTYSGNNNITGSRNVFIGYSAGYNETGSDLLYIDNSSTDYPLIYGDFYNDFAEINGDLHVWGTLYEYSDGTKKTNITPLGNSLDKVLALNGVSFEWADGNERKGISSGSKKSIGVIAQDVEVVLPSLVKESRNGEKAVNYSGLIPVLLEAIKEQQSQIESLEQRIAELEH
ncbi:MAG: tail fiber domain-containing protein, partial [Bacteroidales bacterium]|nr:tail fiber domain-containing protein [Bacteroidales bacterium]